MEAVFFFYVSIYLRFSFPFLWWNLRTIQLFISSQNWGGSTKSWVLQCVCLPCSLTRSLGEDYWQRTHSHLQCINTVCGACLGYSGRVVKHIKFNLQWEAMCLISVKKINANVRDLTGIYMNMVQQYMCFFFFNTNLGTFMWITFSTCTLGIN